MALRTSKITSEIISNCNRLFASSTKLPSASATLSFEPAQESMRYKISNTEKPRDLPEISFSTGANHFQDLQPCTPIGYNLCDKDAKWSETSDGPFPEQIKNPLVSSHKVSDLQKAEEKMLRAKTISFNPITRSYSMRTDIRYAKNEHEDCEPKNNVCVPKLKPCVVKKKAECRLKGDCPKHRLANCKQSKGSDCKRNYLDPDCTKTFAPYPSYSELCAEELPEDPSECVQCPWRSCEDPNANQPKNKKRSYSTSANQMTLGNEIVGAPLTKPPCKPPPSPCEVRREIEEKMRKQKGQTDNKKKKKGQEDDPHQVPILDRQVGQSESMYMNFVHPQSGNNAMELPETTWSYLERDSSIMEASGKKGDRKNQPPNCRIKITPTKEQKQQSDSDNCCRRCPKYKFRSQEEELSCSPTLELKDKKKIKGDEGHPPPCPPMKPTPGFNVPCPKEPLKKPKYKKKPMRQAYYEEAKKDRDTK